MKRILISLMSTILFLPGCVNLKKVNEYASASLKGINKYEELDYTFTKACREKCELEQIRKLTLDPGGCACLPDETGDSLSLVLCSGVKAYYDGLTRISANNLTSYKVDALAKVLKSGEFGNIRIEKAEVDAYAKLSSVLLTAFTDGYRRRKIGTYVAQANDPIQVLLRSLEFNLTTNLVGKINVHKERIQSVYADFLNDPAASSYEKRAVIVEYNDLIEEASVRQKQILSFSKTLKKLASGHQQLYEHKNQMNTKEIKSMLAKQLSELEDIISEFNKLKNK